MKYLLVIAFLFSLSCKKDKLEQQDPKPTTKKEELVELYDTLLLQAQKIRDRTTGWIHPEGCDAFIWDGEYAASPKVRGVDMEAAEFKDQPGRFGRRPPPNCWTPDGANGSKTTWSRDMFVGGLVPWAWLTKDLEALERHAEYGKDNNWKMGEPLDDGRTVYTPAMIGLLYKAIQGLGGEKSSNAVWGNIYPKGLEDYQAHLQVKYIWARGEISHTLANPDDKPSKPSGPVQLWNKDQLGLHGIESNSTSPLEVTKKDGRWRLLSISETMYQRLEEHYKRVPHDAFYAYVWGLYSGDLGPAIDNTLNGTQGGYVRCGKGNEEKCQLAHRIFVIGQILRKLGEL